VQFCDAFNIPLLTLVDIPGYLPGLDQERNGIIRRGAKLFFAYSQATVPMVSVILRKAYGGAYAVMASKHVGADINLAWPTAEVAVMNGHAAVAVLYRKELASITDPDEAEAVRLKWIDEYNDTMLTPYIAAERGYIDAVIRPATTRQHVARALRTLRTKQEAAPVRKHSNIPL
jgi:propionyl-CoA carboxylase beta chain